MNANQPSANIPLVLLPGWGFTSRVWEHFQQALGARFEPAAIDLPQIPEPQNPEQTIRSIVQGLVPALPAKAVILGWSLGGIIGSLLCHEYPERFKGLITVTSTPKFTESEDWYGIQPSRRDYFYKQAHADLPRLLTRFAQMTCYPHKNRQLLQYTQSCLQPVTQNSCTQMRRWLQVLFEADLRQQWQQIQLPQYHLYADQDAIVACSHKKWIRQYTNAQHEVIENGCHGLPIQQPDLLAQKIHHWLHQYA